VVGIVFYVLGLVVLIFAGLNFNNLFFAQKLLTKSDIPTYSQLVFMPILLGVLVLLDGSFIADLKRASSGVLYAVGNLAWLYGFYLMYQRLSVPVSEIDAYRIVFYLTSAGVFAFIIGAILNDIHKSSK
jgi:hypothetical protein